MHPRLLAIALAELRHNEWLDQVPRSGARACDCGLRLIDRADTTTRIVVALPRHDERLDQIAATAASRRRQRLIDAALEVVAVASEYERLSRRTGDAEPVSRQDGRQWFVDR